MILKVTQIQFDECDRGLALRLTIAEYHMIELKLKDMCPCTNIFHQPLHIIKIYWRSFHKQQLI